MTNSLSQDIVAVGQLMADNLNTMGVDDADVEDGLTTLAGKILDVVTEKIDTILEIDIASLNLEYGDDFNITGSLTDENNDAVSSASVKLLVGSTVVDTQTTDSNGDVTFTYCPVSTGTHTFKLVYEGDSTYDGSTSSTVTKTVNKETTYLSVSGSTTIDVYTDESYSVSGTLMDNDSPTPQPVAGKSIVVVESGRTVAVLTTASDGSFSGNISCSDLGGIGSHTVTFTFAGNSNYTASGTQKTVVVHSTSLSLVSDVDVLSYADGDSATLTATYVGGSVEGLTVSFKAYKDGTLVEDIGSDTTDSSGVASVSYSSKGAGDLSIRAECMNLTKTYELEDCTDYQAMTDNSKQSRWTIPSSITSSSIFGYSSNGWKIGNASSYSHMYLEETFSTPTSIEFQLNDYNSPTESPFIRICDTNKANVQGMFTVLNSNITFAGTNLSRNAVKGAVYRREIYSNQMKLYENDILISTVSVTPHSSFMLMNTTGTSRMMQWKDLKIKPL